MNFYKYKAVNSKGESFCSFDYSENPYELFSKVRLKGYYIIKIRRTLDIKQFRFNKKISYKDISVFSKQLSSMLKAGFNISDALEVIYSNVNCKALKNNINSLKKSMLSGNGFYDSLVKYKNLYPNFYIEMINIAEQSGNLDIILEDLSSYYMRQFTIKKSIKSAMVYPAIVFLASIAIFMYMEIGIVPMFANTFKSLGQNMPVYSIVIMNLSKMLVINWKIILVFMLGIFALIYRIFKIKKVKFHMDKFKVEIPFISSIYKKIMGAQFTRSLEVMQKSGANLINSIEMIAKVLGNAFVEKKIDESLIKIQKGESIAKSIESTEIFDHFLISMISMGEQCGNLEEMMRLSADIYDDEIENTIKRFVSLIEPFLIVILAIIVGTIIISVMMPMLKLMQDI
ncbi:MAG: type II secretion system F family protein [Clostridium sp.]|nr:type II secretion system F family protein [Clostridium sp.]